MIHLVVSGRAHEHVQYYSRYVVRFVLNVFFTPVAFDDVFVGAMDSRHGA